MYLLWPFSYLISFFWMVFDFQLLNSLVSFSCSRRPSKIGKTLEKTLPRQFYRHSEIYHPVKTQNQRTVSNAMETAPSQRYKVFCYDKQRRKKLGRKQGIAMAEAQGTDVKIQRCNSTMNIIMNTRQRES